MKETCELKMTYLHVSAMGFNHLSRKFYLCLITAITTTKKFPIIIPSDLLVVVHALTQKESLPLISLEFSGFLAVSPFILFLSFLQLFEEPDCSSPILNSLERVYERGIKRRCGPQRTDAHTTDHRLVLLVAR